MQISLTTNKILDTAKTFTDKVIQSNDEIYRSCFLRSVLRTSGATRDKMGSGAT